MQDSLEDYIRISRNVKEGPAAVTKEILVTAQSKAECSAKALQILQFAIEGKMRSDALFRCLPYINRSHYQDIVEERAISKLCGYPLCSKRIPDMPKRQYYISTKNNKVYDITDRKNYCSNFCYRASIHIKNQIDTSPLWLRKHNEKAHFTLLNKSDKGLPGEVVDQGVAKPMMEPHFTSVSVFTQMSLDEAEELELNTQEEEEPKKQLKKPKKYQKNPMKTINENEEEEQTETESPSLGRSDGVKTESARSEEAKVAESSFKQKRRNRVKLEAKTREKPTNTDLESHIYKCFKDWFTLETYIFIYGEETVREQLDGRTLSDYFDSLRIAEARAEQRRRYVEICRKLHLKQLADEKFDEAVVGGGELNPLPDYRELKEETRELDLKVRSFYRGELYAKEDSNFPGKRRDQEGGSVADEAGPPAVLPLVDIHSQNTLRRKIFLNSLNKTIQTLFQSLKLNPSLVASDLQSLVKTFKLKADNIVFKPPMWSCIAIILLKILSLRDESLRNVLEEADSKQQLNLWLSPLPNQEKTVGDILNILSEVTSFVEEYINCK